MKEFASQGLGYMQNTKRFESKAQVLQQFEFNKQGRAPINLAKSGLIMRVVLLMKALKAGSIL